MNKKRLLFTYIAFDILAAIASWVCLYVYRKVVGESMSFGAIGNAMMADPTFFWGLLLAPTFWVFLHAFFGYYNKVYRKSRLNELKTTIGVTIFGVLVFFFLFILDDIVTSPRDYIKYMFCYFTLQFLLTYIPRVCITTRINRRIHRGLIGFNTIIVGSDAKALQVYNSLQQKLPAPGN